MTLCPGPPRGAGRAAEGNLSRGGVSHEVLVVIQRIRLGLLLLSLAGLCAVAADVSRAPDLATLLNFERDPSGQLPGGWQATKPDQVSLDGEVVHGGRWSARIRRTPESADRFASIVGVLPIDFAGRRVQLRGFLRTAGVVGYAGLWLREDGDVPSLEFDNMQRRGLHGTTDWTEYTIDLPLNSAARRLYFGFLLSGHGTVWADDLQLLVDGSPIWEAAKAVRYETVRERDHEFDAGSKISLQALTPPQVERLATLAEVWGFLKYHHPKITTGQVQWDYELFRVLPAVLGAADDLACNEALARWIEQLGPVAPVRRDADDRGDVSLAADVAWIGNVPRFGLALSERLQAVYAARLEQREQHYVGFVPGVGNPNFEHEVAYSALALPDAGYQLLALFRLWNIVRYWAPYRDLVDGDWSERLREFIPRLALAKSAEAYQLELFALIATLRDTHANLWSSVGVRPPVGEGRVPAAIRWVEGRWVVAELAPVTDIEVNLHLGDVLLAIDGRPVDALVGEWSPYYPASNEPTRRRDVGRAMLRGPVGPVKLRVRRGETEMELESVRVPRQRIPVGFALTHDRPGPAFQRLPGNIAYLKLSTAKVADLRSYLEQAVDTKGWIVDLRNYPAEFFVFALGSHFVERTTDFVTFSMGDADDPGRFVYRPGKPLTPDRPRYDGPIIILVDEVTQSSAEYTAMALRAAPRAIVMGSTTAGADGNVSRILLPGGYSTMISGLGVFYPSRRPTQRVGIVPDVEVHPTVAGITAGRDEVLEAAVTRLTP